MFANHTNARWADRGLIATKNAANAVQSVVETSVIGMKDIILWNHERGTWQYDVFCGLIIAFIFLTPNSWFDKQETLATQTSRLIVKPEDFSAEKSVLQRRVKELSGNPKTEIVEWRKKINAAGDTVYEIDVR